MFLSLFFSFLFPLHRLSSIPPNDFCSLFLHHYPAPTIFFPQLVANTSPKPQASIADPFSTLCLCFGMDFSVCVCVLVWISVFMFVFRCDFRLSFGLGLCFGHGFRFGFMFREWVSASRFMFRVGLWVSASRFIKHSYQIHFSPIVFDI